MLNRFDRDRNGKIDMLEWEQARIQARRANPRPVPDAENEFTDGAIGTMGAPQTQPAGRHTPDLPSASPGPAPNDFPAPLPADANEPVRVQGKFFFAGERKHFVKGVTYGPFAPGTHGTQFPERAAVQHDFALMRRVPVASGRAIELRAEVFNSTNGHHYLDRTVFDGPRDEAPVLFRERGKRAVGPIYSFSVKGSF